MAGRKNRNGQHLIATAAIAGVALVAYGCYKLFEDINQENELKQKNNVSKNDTLENTDVGGISYKFNSSKKVTLVLTKSFLDASIDLRSIVIGCSNLTILVHPSINKDRIIEEYYIPRELSYILIQTTKEESIFHLLKQINSAWNLINFRDFEMDEKDFEGFHLNRFLSNVIDLEFDSEELENDINLLLLKYLS